MRSQEPVIILFLICLVTPPCSLPSGEDARDWPCSRIRLASSESQENPGGKWPFCGSRLSVLRPCSVGLGDSQQCWRKLACLSTKTTSSSYGIQTMLVRAKPQSVTQSLAPHRHWFIVYCNHQKEKKILQPIKMFSSFNLQSKFSTDQVKNDGKSILFF